MPQPERPPRATLAVLGLITAGAGLYFVLVGAAVLPLPGKANAPGWIVAAAGLAFLFGGIAVLVQDFFGASDQGELPPDAPAWGRLLQHLAALGVVGSLAAIGTWVALAGHADKFSGPPGVGITVMRTAFGLGAAVTWLYFLALARRTLRLALGHGKA